MAHTKAPTTAHTKPAGYTLVELMITGSLMSVFAITLLSFTWQQRAADQQHAAYTTDLLSARRAMNRIVADLRGATSVQPTAKGITIYTDAGVIRYAMDSGRLDRLFGSSRRQRIASGIADLGCWQQGHTAHVRLVLRARMKVVGRKHQPAIETSVALRLAGRKERNG